MQKEPIKERYNFKRRIVMLLFIFIAMPGTLMVSWKFGDRRYYLCSLLLIMYAMVPFFASFERRRPEARELVTIAVMSAIAVASRAAFMMVPFFKPITGIIMITGMAFGPEAGFLTGALSGFVSNFIFGQGPWTPWQMFAFGIAGFLAAVLTGKGLIGKEKRIVTSVTGGAIVLLIIGPVLDTCTLFTMSSSINWASAAGIYLSGLPVNLVHAAATILTLFVLEKPMLEKLDRIKIKYGMMGGEEDAV